MKYFKKSIFWLWFKWYSITKIKTGTNRIPLLLLRFLGRVEYKVEGVVMKLSPHEFFWRQMMSGKITNDPVLNYLKEHLPQNGNFLDIGANIGFFSCWAAINRNAQVFSIEPSSRETNIFKINLDINNIRNAVVLPFGCGNKSERLLLNLSPASHPGMNSLVYKPVNNGIEEEIVIKRIDELFETETLLKMDVCKVDVEGFEIEVLKGFGIHLNKMKNCKFIIEISPHFLKYNAHKVEDLYSIFNQNGFKPLRGMNNSKQYDELFYYP